MRKVFESVRTIGQGELTVLPVGQIVRRALTLAHRARALENGRLVPRRPDRDLRADDRLERVYRALQKPPPFVAEGPGSAVVGRAKLLGGSPLPTA